MASILWSTPLWLAGGFSFILSNTHLAIPTWCIWQSTACRLPFCWLESSLPQNKDRRSRGTRLYWGSNLGPPTCWASTVSLYPNPHRCNSYTNRRDRKSSESGSQIVGPLLKHFRKFKCSTRLLCKFLIYAGKS